jgi:hypothetical protein
MGIVQEIVEAVRPIIETDIAPEFSKMNYQYLVNSNSERSLEKRYGFTVGPASGVDGQAIGFCTVDHIFRLELLDSFLNKDCDDALENKIFELHGLIQKALKKFQKSKLALPTIGNRVILITLVGIDEPEIVEENQIVSITANFNFKYQYRH